MLTRLEGGTGLGAQVRRVTFAWPGGKELSLRLSEVALLFERGVRLICAPESVPFDAVIEPIKRMSLFSPRLICRPAYDNLGSSLGIRDFPAGSSRRLLASGSWSKSI